MEYETLEIKADEVLSVVEYTWRQLNYVIPSEKLSWDPYNMIGQHVIDLLWAEAFG